MSTKCSNLSTLFLLLALAAVLVCIYHELPAAVDQSQDAYRMPGVDRAAVLEGRQGDE